MKKNIPLIGVLTAVILLFTSCSKQNNSSIVGTWRWVESEITTYIDGALSDSHVSKSEDDFLFEFKADGTMTMIEKNGSKISTTSGSYIKYPHFEYQHTRHRG